jgi:hypothetical protein
VAAQAQPSQAAEVASSNGDSGSGQKTFHHGITYVSYEGNCFWVKFNNSGVHSNTRIILIATQHCQRMLRATTCRKAVSGCHIAMQVIQGYCHCINRHRFLLMPCRSTRACRPLACWRPLFL